jgi:hypothetical protein
VDLGAVTFLEATARCSGVHEWTIGMYSGGGHHFRRLWSCGKGKGCDYVGNQPTIWSYRPVNFRAGRVGPSWRAQRASSLSLPLTILAIAAQRSSNFAILFRLLPAVCRLLQSLAFFD